MRGPPDVSLAATQCFTFTHRLFLRNMRPVTRFRLGKCYFVRLGKTRRSGSDPVFCFPPVRAPNQYVTDQKSGERVVSILVHGFPV